MDNPLELIEDDGSSPPVPFCCDLNTSILTCLLHILPGDGLRPALPSPFQCVPISEAIDLSVQGVLDLRTRYLVTQ